MTGALLGWTKDYKGEGRGLANSALGLQRLEELLLGGVRLVDVKACWAALWRLGLGRGVGGWREGGDAGGGLGWGGVSVGGGGVGTRMMTSPGLARCNSSRAMRSMAWG